MINNSLFTNCDLEEEQFMKSINIENISVDSNIQIIFATCR